MRNKRFFSINFIVALLLTTLTSGAYAAGSFSIIYGEKSLEKNDWKPVESQTGFGVVGEYKEPNWPVALVATYFRSEDSALLTGAGANIKITGETTELGFGIRKYLNENRLRFFVEGGLVSISAKIKAEVFGVSASDSDSNIGYWLGAGADVMVNDTWSIGLFARKSDASVTLGGVNGEAGGTHVGISAAYHFDN